MSQLDDVDRVYRELPLKEIPWHFDSAPEPLVALVTKGTVAPCRAKLMVSVPMPQPISKTFFPFHRSNSAKRGICGSTKYFRASTSSKYSFVPTDFGE